DRIRIGESQFLFLIDEGGAISKSSHVKLDDGHVLSGSTVQIRFDDALYVMARDLSALMKVSTTINAIRGVEELQKTLLELLFEGGAAEGGVVLVTEAGPEADERQFSSVFGLDRLRGPDQSITVSRKVTKWVLSHGESMLITNEAETKDF